MAPIKNDWSIESRFSSNQEVLAAVVVDLAGVDRISQEVGGPFHPGKGDSHMAGVLALLASCHPTLGAT